MPINRIEQELAEGGVLGNLPRIGKLRKGGEKQPTKPGPDLDHFRLALEPQYKHLYPAFEQLYTSEPTSFHNVLLAAETADNAFTYWYEHHAHAKLVRRCDGDEIVLRYVEDRGYDAHHLPCACDPNKLECKQHGYMDIVLPDLCNVTGMWGKITLVTTSIYDVIALRKCMIVAGAFASQLHNVSFWSIPFTIGRAPMNVPVTINGKRSIKNMSLIYAHVDTEFNRQVFTPLLSRPAQLLLAGVNAETGEMPEIPELPDMVIEQGQNWDYDFVCEQTLHLFNHVNHQFNTLASMSIDGELLPEMDDNEAISKIVLNRSRRAAENAEAIKDEINPYMHVDENGDVILDNQNTEAKIAPQSNADGLNQGATAERVDIDPANHWTRASGVVLKFVAAAQFTLSLNHGNVIAALRYIQPGLENVDQFTGTKDDAWAACLALKCNYNVREVRVYLGDNVQMAETVVSIIESHELTF